MPLFLMTRFSMFFVCIAYLLHHVGSNIQSFVTNQQYNGIQSLGALKRTHFFFSARSPNLLPMSTNSRSTWPTWRFRALAALRTWETMTLETASWAMCGGNGVWLQLAPMRDFFFRNWATSVGARLRQRPAGASTKMVGPDVVATNGSSTESTRGIAGGIAVDRVTM